MQDLVLLVGLLLAALLASGLAWKAWGRTANLGLGAKILARSGLTLLMLLPVFLMLLFATAVFEMKSAEGPPTGSDIRPKKNAAPPEEEKPGEPQVLPRYAEPSDGDGATEGEPVGEPAPEEDTAGAEPPLEPDAPAPDLESGAGAGPSAPMPTPPPPPARPVVRDDEGTTRGLSGEDLGGVDEEAAAPEPTAPATPPATGEAAETWEVVPVFYGTDRSRVDTEKRINYGDGRGRRLELGQALVTVPKSHTVPQIERPWSFRIPFTGIEIGESEDPKEHFTMKEIKALSEADFLALVGQRLAASKRYEKHALIFVHGFNTTFDFAVYRTAQIAYDLKFDGAPFTYSWPSGGGVLNYTYDRESSGQSQPFLRDFIKLVLEKTGAKAVSVVAHSMGNQPTLQVLKDLKAAKPEGVLFNQIILAAPDVDRDNFENIAREISGLAKGITLYASKNDKALAISRNVNGGVPRAGDVPAGGPLITEGVETVDVTQVSTDSLGLNHSGYAENNDLLQDVRVLIEKGLHPPEKRFPTTKVLTSPHGPYWELVPAPPAPPAVP